MAPLLVRTMALLALGVVVGYATNGVRADGVSLDDFEAPASCSGEPVHVDPDAEECDPPEVLESHPEDEQSPEPRGAQWSVAP